MAKAEGIPPTASTASVGFGINYIGNHCYAYSGPVSIDHNETAYLSFTTGEHYIFGTFQAQYFADNNDVYLHKLKMNDLEVVGFEFNGSNNADGAIAREIIIPPFTKVEVTASNTSSQSTLIPVGGTITGRVYGAA